MSSSVTRPPLFDDLEAVVGNPGAAPKHIDPAIIQQVSETQNFPNRDARRGTSDAPPAQAQALAQGPAPKATPIAAPTGPATGHQPRRFRTGRNIPVNIKLDEATRQMLYETAEKLDAPLGEVVERALVALRDKLATPKKG